MSKDWTGNKRTTFATLGASSHGNEERQVDDYYATDPQAMVELLKLEQFNADIWECASGGGHLSQVLIDNGYNVRNSDIVDRGAIDTEIIDFLEYQDKWHGDIITNPPYKYAKEFVEKAHEVIIEDGSKIAMFLKLTFLESKKRKPMFDKYPPKKIYVFSQRVECGKNGVFGKGSAVCYAWFVWEKGYTGDITVELI